MDKVGRFGWLLLVAVACSDVTAPCDDACGAADLAVTEVALVGRTSADTIFSDDTLRVRAVVANLGAALPDSSELFVWLEGPDLGGYVRVPPMAARSSRIVLTDIVLGPIHPETASVGRLQATVRAYPARWDTISEREVFTPDGDPGNDERAGSTFPVGVRTISIDGPTDLPILKPTVYTLTVRNPTPRALRADSIQLCFWDVDTCFDDPWWLDTPEIPARTTKQIPISIDLPFADQFQYVYAAWGAFSLRACFPQSPNDTHAILNYRTCGSMQTGVTFLPNFSATCPQRVIELGAIVMGSAATDCAPINRRYSVWSFHAEAGQRFELTSFGPSAVGIVNERGLPDVEFGGRSHMLVAPSAGTYYVQALGGEYRFRLDRR
jgi:hypothetical protein